MDTDNKQTDSKVKLSDVVMQICTVVVDVFPTSNPDFDQAYNVWQTYPGQEPPQQYDGTTRYLVSFEIPKKLVKAERQIEANSVLEA